MQDKRFSIENARIATTVSVKRPRIGFIGLGLMGKPMSKNLLKAGYHVTVFNRSKQAMEELRAAGADLGGSPRAVAENSDIVIAMVPDSKDVRDVILGPSGVIHSARPGMVVIDMGTISPAVEREISLRFAEKGVDYLDAPVTGGQEGAAKGTLSIIVGGQSAVLRRCIDVLKAMGSKVTHVGPIGSGQIVKACNQLMTAMMYVGVGEALAMGTKAGVDPATIVEALKDGTARCLPLEKRAPRVIERNFAPGFKAKHHLKDLGIVRELVEGMGLDLPGSALAYRMFNVLVNDKNRGDWDTSSVMTVIEDANDVLIQSKTGGESEGP